MQKVISVKNQLLILKEIKKNKIFLRILIKFNDNDDDDDDDDEDDDDHHHNQHHK